MTITSLSIDITIFGVNFPIPLVDPLTETIRTPPDIFDLLINQITIKASGIQKTLIIDGKNTIGVITKLIQKFFIERVVFFFQLNKKIAYWLIHTRGII